MSKTPPNRIKEFRKKKGLTLEELAERVSSTKGNIWKLERGDNRLTQLWMNRLSDALGCLPHELMYELESETAATDNERRLLNTFRQMDDREQQIYLSTAEAFLRGAENGNPTTKPKKESKK